MKNGEKIGKKAMPGVLDIDFTKVKRKIRSAPGSAKTSPTLTRKGTVAEIFKAN